LEQFLLLVLQLHSQCLTALTALTIWLLLVGAVAAVVTAAEVVLEGLEQVQHLL
jgi:hypothetical protein